MNKSGVCRVSKRCRLRTGSVGLRVALAAASAAAVLVAADAANAQFFGPTFGRPYTYYDPYGSYGVRQRMIAPADPYYFKPQRKRIVAPKKEPQVKPPAGPLLIAISLNNQRLTLYSNGAPIAHSPVSTGTASHPTPTGIFSVIGKERFHRSNLYSNAPMPFMQRITWSGVALHQGVLPGYPASHGCIRLPGSFAQNLWGTTRMGARVIITRDEVAPFDIAHAKLFAPKPNADREPPADQVQASGPLKVAESDNPAKSSDAPKPVVGTAEIEAARAAALKGALEAQGAAARVPMPAWDPAKTMTASVELSDMIDAREPSPTAFDGATSGAAADSTNKGGRVSTTEMKETPRMSEPVSVFVSRKAGRLYVRQGFEPLFDVPVTIRDPDLPLGTHLYTAVELKDDRSAMRWVAVTLSNHGASEPERRKDGKKTAKDDQARAPHVPASVRLAAAAALDRVEMPKETVDRIADLLSPGASLIISDYPLSGETGKYTDFIILTR